MSRLRLGLSNWLERLRESLWVVPGAGLLVALGLQQVLVTLDQELWRQGSAWFRFGGGAEGARALVSAIAQSTLTMTAVVFSVTMLTLQLASGQLSPRVMRSFLGDRYNQVVLAVFISTFAYALLVLRSIRADFVPGATITGSFVLAAASVGAFIGMIDHMAQSVRSTTVIGRLGAQTRAAIERVHPDPVSGGGEALPYPPLPERPADIVYRWGDDGGLVTRIDPEAVLAAARDSSCRIALTVALGDFVPRGGVFARVWTDSDSRRPPSKSVLEGAVRVSAGRSMTQDVAFGFRQLVDVAERALSPGVNDPTTAVEVLNQLHELLLMVSFRDLSIRVQDARTAVGVVWIPGRGWDNYVDLALTEIGQYGAQSSQVVARMRSMVDELLESVPEERQAALRRQRRRLDESPKADPWALAPRPVRGERIRPAGPVTEQDDHLPPQVRGA